MQARRFRRWLRHGRARLGAATERLLPDRVIYARNFRRTFGRRLNLRQPSTFNEKLYWLMLYYRPSLLTRLADKYEVRGYVADRIGEKYLNELYGVWDNPDDIDFAALPDMFALKVSNGWKMNVFCRDRRRFDADATRAQLREWRRRPHYWTAREWAYKDAPSRVMAERLLVDARWGTPPDYKVSCFNGEPGWIGVHFDRFGNYHRDLFDPQWRRAPFDIVDNLPPSADPVARPDNLEEIVECARRLAKGLPFVRVDFMVVDGRTVFGELTLYPAAAQITFSPDSWDRYWGDALQLPTRTHARG